MKKSQWLSLLVLPMLLLAACSSKPATSPAPSPAPTSSDAAKTPAPAKLEQSTITIYSAKDAQMAAQMLVAQDKGYFKDEGLTVDLKFYQAGSEIPQGMASGAIKIGAAGWVNPVLLASSKFDIKIITLTSDLAGSLGFVVKADSGIKSPKDFEGKKMGMLQVGILNEAWTRVVQKYGIDASKVKIVNGDPSSTLTAFQSGQVDVLFTYQPFLANAVKAGGKLVLTGTMTDFGQAQQERNYFGYGTIFATGDFIKANPNTLKAFLRALMKANDVLIKDPAGAAKILSPTLGLDPDILIQNLKQNGYDHIQFTDDWLKTYADVNNYLFKIGELKAQPPEPASFVDTSLLKAVAPEMVKGH